MVVAILVMLAVVMLVAVLPTSTLLDQRDELAMRKRELSELQSRNDVLAAEALELNKTETVEVIARRDYGLVLPGEEVFAVLPPAPDPVPLPDAWPFTDLAEQLGE